MHNAVFTINLVAVGVALFSFGRAATLSQLIPAWMGPVTGVGGGLLLASALPAVAVVNGSGWMAVGLLGFLTLDGLPRPGRARPAARGSGMTPADIDCRRDPRTAGQRSPKRGPLPVVCRSVDRPVALARSPVHPLDAECST
jgi:hypothetical protein